MLSDDELAAIEARVRDAAPGPWGLVPDAVLTLDAEGRYLVGFDRRRTNGRGLAVALAAGPGAMSNIAIVSEPSMEPSEAKDAEFIAAARQDVPSLVAEVKRLRGLLKDLYEFADDYRNHLGRCAKAHNPAAAECDCGLSRLLASARGGS